MTIYLESFIHFTKGQVNEQAVAIVRDALVWDMTLPWAEGYAYDDLLPRFKASNYDVISLTVGGSEVDLAYTMRWIAQVSRKLELASDTMRLCYSVEDIDQARAEGKLALIYNLQETRHFQKNIELVGLFYRLGVRHALLAYNARNNVGDGCAERTDSGLSRFGLEVVAEMNRVGMLVCGTHSGYRTTMDAMEATTAPFIFSHCNAWGVYPHYRNIRDDQILACAKTGGVIGVNGLGEFLDDHEARSETMFRHIDYIAQLAGPEHVGIGLDYVKDVSGFWQWVRDNPHMWPVNENQARTYSKFAQPEQIYELVELMLEHGYSRADIDGILGQNFRRVCQQVWK